MVIHLATIQNTSIRQKGVLLSASFWLYIFLISSFDVLADCEDPDTVGSQLPDLIVDQKGQSQFSKREDGSILVKKDNIDKLSRIFGEVDFVNQIGSLHSVSSISDYGSGFFVSGTQPSQAQYLIDGAPVAFPYRFGGLFSTFNTDHFSSMEFSRQSGSDMAPRLGSAFSLSSAERFRPGVEGNCNIGMMASSISLRAGFVNKFSISASGRISYIDQIYKKWLTTSDVGIKYDFKDLNATFAYRISASDVIKASCFLSGDNIGYDDIKYSLNTSIKWTNTLYNISYERKRKNRFNINAFYSKFNNTIALGMPQMMVDGPSYQYTCGLNSKLIDTTPKGKMAFWNCGFNLIYTKDIPQWASLESYDASEASIRYSNSYPQKSITSALYGEAGFWLIPEKIKLIAETAIGYYGSKTIGHRNYSALIFTPSLTLLAKIPKGAVNLSCSRPCQPVHQVGFSELGLATNYMISANHEAPVQRALAVSGNVSQNLPWLGLSAEVGAYWNVVKNQTEYQGQVMEIITIEYNPFSHLIISDGYNYGAYLSVAHAFGKVTGDINLSYGNGLRHGPNHPDQTWHALNSSGFTLKASAQWHEGKHWTMYASFLLASGRRYTPVNALYMISNNIATEYGKRNSATLPMYNRLDIGATYSFSTGKNNSLRHDINLTFINALGHRNVEMQYFVLNSENGDYYLKRLYSLYRFLPSLSYSIEFQ